MSPGIRFCGRGLNGPSHASGGRVPLTSGSMGLERKQYNNNKRPWSSGMTVASQASNPGSIPGGRICLSSLPRNTIPEH